MIKNGQVVAMVLVLAGCPRPPERDGYQGVIELDERVLAFELPGRVLEVKLKRGDTVAANQLVATLDDSQGRASLAVREAEVKVAEKRVELVAAGGRTEDIRAIEAQIRAARATEQLAIKRYNDDLALVAQGAVPRAVADDSDARRKTTIAERQALEQRLREVKAGARKEEVASASAQQNAAKAVVELEADRVNRYQLRSQHAGEVLDVHIEAGEVVGAATPVATIGDPSHPYVDVFVPQQSIAGVRVGQVATVEVDSLSQGLRGTVEHVARRTEFTPRFIFSRAERANLVVRVRVRVDDPGRVLHAGLPAFVTLAR